MSAIYGVVDTIQENKLEDMGLVFAREYEACKIDRFGSKSACGAFFGCGIQYFTGEAREEILPILDETRGMLFTADCLLDNREDIIALLKDNKLETSVEYDSQDLNGLPDGTLIYLLYLLKGEECVKELRGAFSFAVYDMKAKKLGLFADQFANRCLFYSTSGSQVVFSTLFFPLIKASGRHFEINERWMVDCISVRGPMMMTEEIETPLRGILKVDCGCFVTLTLKEDHWETKRTVYYDPRKRIKVNKHIDDSQAGQEFVRVFGKAVENCLRTDGEVGIQLSSGLDSSAVAGFAAPILDKRDKKLYSYTSVPLRGSVENQGGSIFNETEGVMLICEMHPNVVPTFVDCQGKSTISEIDKTIATWELPCKSQMNAVWIADIFERAYNEGCRVLLSGSTGNCTISSGAIGDYYYNQVITGHPINAFRSFVHYFDKIGAMKKVFFKAYIKQVVSEKINPKRKKVDCYSINATRKDIGEQYDLTRRFTGRIYGQKSVRHFADIRETLYFRNSYAQIGEIDTKMSLAYGVIERDPTRNVELIELLLSFPQRMFVNEDYDRRLAREFVKGIVPDAIRLNVRSRGVQGGDNIYRIGQIWENVKEETGHIVCREDVYRYLEQNKIKKLIEAFDPSDLYAKEDEILLLMDVLSFAKYLDLLTKL